MLNRREVVALKKVIKAITAKKIIRNFWMEDEQGCTCFGMDYFFVRLKTEDVPQDLNIPTSLQKEKMLVPVKEIIESFYTEAEDTGLLEKSGKGLLKIISRLSDQKLVYVNNKFDFGLQDYLISVESDTQKDYPITLYEKGGLEIYVLPIRVQQKNKFLK